MIRECYKNYELERKEAELRGSELLGNLIKEKIIFEARIPPEAVKQYQQFKLIKQSN